MKPIMKKKSKESREKEREKKDRLNQLFVSQSHHHHLRPSHHALSFSLRCGILSLISVSRSLANSTLRALLLLLGLSALSTPVLLRLGNGPRSSAGNVLLGENVSLLPFLDVGLANPPALLLLKSALRGRAVFRFDRVEVVAGGFLM